MKTGRNSPCPCGSGRKFKHCCLNRRAERNKTKRVDEMRDSLTLNQRNSILLDATTDIFGFREARHWDDIRRNVTEDRIRKLYLLLAELWPPHTDLPSLLPVPDNKLRALYLGDPHPHALAENIVRFSLYADEILVINPFMNPWVVADEYNPVEHPELYKSDTLKLVLFLGILEPWMRSGIVRLIRDPGEFDPELQKETMRLSKALMADLTTKDVRKDDLTAAMADAKRSLLNLPTEYLVQMLRRVHPELGDEEVPALLAGIQELRLSDPLALLNESSPTGSELTILRSGTNLHMGLAMSMMTGAFPYTNLRLKWEYLLRLSDEMPDDARVWTPLTNAFQGLDFKFLNAVDPGFACSLRKEGRLEGFRGYLRKIGNSLTGISDIENMQSLARDFQDELKGAYSQASAEWDAIDRDLLKGFGVGATAAAATLVSGTLSPAIPAAGFVCASVFNLLNSRLKRREFRKKVPMSILIDLSKKSRRHA